MCPSHGKNAGISSLNIFFEILIRVDSLKFEQNVKCSVMYVGN